MTAIPTPLNMDRSERVVIRPEDQDWLPSPNPKVLRKPLERERAESGETTSIVRYLPNSVFSPHSHPLGEEIYVLDGEFADEKGRYPAGTYIRNPPGSRHTPYSEIGCTLFVKLNQFDPDDTQQLTLLPEARSWQAGHGRLRVQPLHSHGTTSTAVVQWPVGARFQPHTHFGGEEIFVLSGTFEDEFGAYPKWTWLRNPHRSSHDPFSTEGSDILVRVGHLSGVS
ncbi:MAG: cupin domain-containing protein [Myxococcota bacterium]